MDCKLIITYHTSGGRKIYEETNKSDGINFIGARTRQLSILINKEIEEKQVVLLKILKYC